MLYPYRPYPEPVPPPDDDPGAEPLWRVAFNEGWRAYLLGAASVLTVPQTFEGTPEEIEQATRRGDNLLALIAEGDPLDIRFQNSPTNCTILQFSKDSGANWVDTQYDPALCVAIALDNELRFRRNPTESGFRLEVSTDSGSSWTDTAYTVPPVIRTVPDYITLNGTRYNFDIETDVQDDVTTNFYSVELAIPSNVGTNIDGATATTLNPGTEATATLIPTGYLDTYSLNIGVPRGADGQGGLPGLDGANGIDGDRIVLFNAYFREWYDFTGYGINDQTDPPESHNRVYQLQLPSPLFVNQQTVEVTALAAGEQPTVTISPEPSDSGLDGRLSRFNFGIPAGSPGADGQGGLPGLDGANGVDGHGVDLIAPPLTVLNPDEPPELVVDDALPAKTFIGFKLPRAATFDTLPTITGTAGTSADVAISSDTNGDKLLQFTIPRGDTGAAGAQGIQGIQGEPGASGSGFDDQPPVPGEIKRYRYHVPHDGFVLPFRLLAGWTIKNFTGAGLWGFRNGVGTDVICGIGGLSSGSSTIGGLFLASAENAQGSQFGGEPVTSGFEFSPTADVFIRLDINRPLTSVGTGYLWVEFDIENTNAQLELRGGGAATYPTDSNGNFVVNIESAGTIVLESARQNSSFSTCATWEVVGWTGQVTGSNGFTNCDGATGAFDTSTLPTALTGQKKIANFYTDQTGTLTIRLSEPA